MINLDTDATELSDQTFYFDLDADGEEEEISMLKMIRRTDSGDDVCRAVTRWTQKVRLP